MVLDMTTKKKLHPALAARARAAAAMTPAQRAAWAKKMQAARKAKAPRAAKKNPPPKRSGRAFVDYAPIARNPPPTHTNADKQWCAVGSNANNYSGKAVYRTFGAGASAQAACRAYCAEHDCTAHSLTDDQITAIDTGEGTPAQIRAINARADRRGKKNPPKKTAAAKNPPVRVPAREALSALHSLSIADSDQAAAKFERLMDADRDSLTVARIPLAVTGSRTVRLWWTENGAPIQIRVTFEDESPNRADFAAFNAKHRT